MLQSRAPIGIAIVVVDVADRETVDEARRFQAALLGAVSEAVIVVDPTGHVLKWNEAAQRIYGWSATEAIGRRARDLLGGEETANETEAKDHRLRQGQSWSRDCRVRRRDGVRFWAHLTDTPVFGSDGALLAVIEVSSDMTQVLGGRRSGPAARRHCRRFG